MTTNPADEKAVAELTDAMFTNGSGEEADRLMLVKDHPHRDLGGWCRGAIRDRVLALAARIRAEASGEVERERASKNGAYDERNRVVAVLASLFPSSLERHPDEDTTWENDWRWIVFVDLPTGQATWHIHDSHLPLFDHVTRFTGRKWDGHNTEAKYKRIEAMVRMTAIDAALKGDA